MIEVNHAFKIVKSSYITLLWFVFLFQFDFLIFFKKNIYSNIFSCVIIQNKPTVFLPRLEFFDLCLFLNFHFGNAKPRLFCIGIGDHCQRHNLTHLAKFTSASACFPDPKRKSTWKVSLQTQNYSCNWVDDKFVIHCKTHLYNRISLELIWIMLSNQLYMTSRFELINQSNHLLNLKNLTQ